MSAPASNRHDQRIARAEELAAQYPFAREILTFYIEIVRFQKTAGSFPEFLALVARVGPAPVAARAHELAQQSADQLRRVLDSPDPDSAPDQFFSRAFRQPFREAQFADAPPGPAGRRCPACGAAPQLAVLRPEGDGAKRSLICSLCSTEWEYLRVVCPSCGETEPARLPVYTAAEFPHIRVDACDSCKTYVKTVDLTKTGLAVPVVDELASLPLNLWAHEHGYKKLAPNLLGF